MLPGALRLSNWPVVVLIDAAALIGMVRGPAATARAPRPRPQRLGPPLSRRAVHLFWAGLPILVHPYPRAGAGGSGRTWPLGVLPDAADLIGVVRGPAAAARAPTPRPQSSGPPLSMRAVQFFGLAFPFWSTHNLGREAADRAAVGLWGSYPMRPTRSAWSGAHPPPPEPRYLGPKIRGPGQKK